MAKRRLTPDPVAWPPRGLSRDLAARYIGVGVTEFDEMVADGRMPMPRRIGGRRVWDRFSIDAAFDALSEDGARDQENEWDSVLGDTEQSAPTSPKVRSGGRITAEQYFAETRGMSEAELATYWREREKAWRESIPGTPLNKREIAALERLACAPLGQAVPAKHLPGCGVDTTERLRARGFIETRPLDRSSDRIGYFVLTALGLKALQPQTRTGD